MKTTTRHQPLGLITTLGLALSVPAAFAADVTWIGNTSNLWNTGSNWSTSAIPANGDTLIFGNSGSSGVALSDDISSLTVGGAGTNGIVLGSSAGGYTISRPVAQTITLASSGGGIGIKDTSLFLQTISAPLTYASNQTIQVGETTGAALSSLTLAAQSGGFRLTKTGTGLLTMGGSGALGGLTINQGTVNIGSDAMLSLTAPASPTAGWLVINGGTLRAQVNTAFTLNANRGIALGDSTVGSGGTINVTSTGGSGTTLTYNGVITDNGAVGGNSLTKTGALTLVLGGSNTYTGATKINQGQLTLDFTTAGAPTSNIINGSSSLVMGDVPTSLGNAAAGNPILFVQGSNAAATTQTFNGASFALGNSNIVSRGGTGAFASTVALGAISHAPGGTVGFSLINNSGTAAITTTTANTNGILGGFATTGATAVGTGTAPVTQTDWAANDGSGNIVAYTGYTIPTGASPTLANNGANNVRIDATSTLNVTPTFGSNLSDLNTIQMTDTTSRTLAIGSGNTLRLGQYGGVWKSAATNSTLTIGTSTAAGGTLTAGGAPNQAGEIVFNSNADTTTRIGISVNSVIADNGTGAVSVVKTGQSVLSLNAANTYTGGTFVNQGTINAGNANAFGGAGKNVTILTGGTVSLTGTSLTYANNFNLGGSGTLILGGNTASGTITLLADSFIGAASSSAGGTVSGKITGDYNLSLLSNVTTFSNTANDFTGSFGINGLSGATGSATVTLKLGDNEVLPHGAGKGNVNIGGGLSGTANLDLNGKTETINGLTSSGTLANVRVTNTAATAGSLILGGNDQTATFGGTIIDGTGVVAITKIGAGTQTFSGLNTYTGGTAVNAGTLAIANSFTMSGANQMTIAGTGVAGTNYATVKNTSGTLTFGGTLGINVTASLSGGESFTLFSANGGTLAGGFSSVSLTGSYLASLTDSGSGVWTGSSNGLDFTFSTSGINAGVLSVSAVPEPATYAAFFGTLALAGAVLRRRSRQVA